MTSDRTTLITATIDQIPGLPAIVSRVIQITSDPESSADDLMEIISADQAYAVKILKMANSAFYGRVQEVVTLRQALMVIGFKGVRDLVMASAVFNSFRQLKRVEGFDAVSFWRHGFLTGLAARMVARQLKQPEGELFVAGLIHDVGKLPIIMALPAEFTKIVRMTGGCGSENITAEKHLLGITHTDVAKRLFRRWMFPDRLVAAVQHHHHRDLTEKSYTAALVIHLADLLAHIAANNQNHSETMLYPEGCFSADTAASARAHNVTWDVDSVKAMVAELEKEMQIHAGALATLLSDA